MQIAHILSKRIQQRFYGIKNKKIQLPTYSGNKPPLQPLSEEHLQKSPLTPADLRVATGQLKWKKQPRIATLVRKLGMMTLYDKYGAAHPVTALHLDKVQALGARLLKHVHTGYERIVQEFGAGVKSPHTTRRHLQLYYRRCGVAPKLKMVGSVVKDVLPPGTWIRAGHYLPGQYVDVTGRTKGKGFQGGMKRHGFKGFPASHGASLSHRAIGSVGSRRDGKIWKGKKMPGRMGNEARCVKHLFVFKVDHAADVVYVRGCVPGPRKGWLILRDSRSNPIFKQTPPPYPTFMPKAGITLPREAMADAPTNKDPLYTAEEKIK